MGVSEIIRLMEAKLSALNNSRSTAAAIGDIQSVILTDVEIFETEQAILQLKNSLLP